MEEDKEVKKESTIRYTDPSELHGLEKFLKKGIEERDERMRISDKVLGLKVPEIKELDDSVALLKVGDNLRLDNSVVPTTPNVLHDPEELDNTIFRTTGASDLVESLDDSVFSLTDKSQPSSLDNTTVYLENTENLNLRLSEKVESLLVNNDIKSLDDSKELLQSGDPLKSLDDSVETLYIGDQELGLDDSKSLIDGIENLETLDDSVVPLDINLKNQKLKLSDEVETLDVKETLELDTGKIKLRVPQDVALDNSVAELDIPKPGNLDYTVIPGPTEKEVPLDNSVSTLDTEVGVVGLSEVKMKSPDSRTPNEISKLREDKEMRPEIKTSQLHPEYRHSNFGLDNSQIKLNLSKDQRKSYSELQKYFNLDSPEQAMKVQMTIEEYESSGNWGKKAAAIYSAILGKNEKMKSFIPPEDIKRLVNSFSESFGGADESDFHRGISPSNPVPNINLENRETPGTPNIPDSNKSVMEGGLGKYLSKKPELSDTGQILGQNTLSQDLGYAIPGDEKENEKTQHLISQTIGGARYRPEIPDYKLSKFNWETDLNASKYIRWAVEKTVGVLKAEGAAKQQLIDEALRLAILTRTYAERLTHTNPERLPGPTEILQEVGKSLISGQSLKTTVSNVIGSMLSENRVGPVNRPGEEGGRAINPRGTTTTVKRKTIGELNEEDVKTATDTKTSETSTWHSNRGDVNFYNSYIWGIEKESDILRRQDLGLKEYGLSTTVEGLLPGMEDISELGVYENFKDAWMKSPYTTTSVRLVNWDSPNRDVITLDSNHVWEIQFSPYVGQLNGYRSWLPSFGELNFLNKQHFGYMTHWNTWIPFQTFQVQKAKMTAKNLPLYDGSIDYPMSIEFTNELRLTIADDMYKSWKRYFERVMECSVYLSTIHDPSYYNITGDQFWNDTVIEKDKNGVMQKSSRSSQITQINKKYQTPGHYKNLTFRCVIYCMTPQFFTVKKLDLLVVLRDLMEDWEGQMDAADTELALSFSIVGENPEHARTVMNTYSGTPADWGIGDLHKESKVPTNYGNLIRRGLTGASKILM